MSVVARMSMEDRHGLFGSVANDPSGVLPRPIALPIVEKDAWVCFLLERLYRIPGFAPTATNAPVLFKGGTSLSKAFRLIERFSEDVDVTLDPALFGMSHATPPGESSSARRRRLDAINAACSAFVCGNLQSALARDLSDILGVENPIVVDPDDSDRQTLRFLYPGSASSSATYVLPYVKLEFGARSDREPWELRPIRSWAAQARPEAGLDPAFDVPVLRAERTFWEKATILHAENTRARSGKPPPKAWTRLSRHAYDLASMEGAPVANDALNDGELLRRVCECKQERFPSGHVNYLAVDPTSIEIVPRGALLLPLESDYERMSIMFFGEPPPWANVMAGLESLERRVRQMPWGPVVR